MMDFSFLADDWHYLLWGTFPEGPPGGALLTLLLGFTGWRIARLPVAPVPAGPVPADRQS